MITISSLEGSKRDDGSSINVTPNQNYVDLSSSGMDSSTTPKDKISPVNRPLKIEFQDSE